MKLLSKILIGLALVLSHMMCIDVAYSYCNLSWAGRYAGFSGTPDIAFFFAIPYLIGILACIISAFIIRRKSNKTNDETK